jgi:aquaporin Z
VTRTLVAEFLGTFVLVFGGVGTAVLTAGFPVSGVGILGVALAFWLSVLTMAYAVGHISGGHFNPAVSLGLWAAGRFKAAALLPYIAAQVVGGVLGAAAVFGGSWAWPQLWAFIVWPVVGALAAGVLYRTVLQLREE